MKSIVKFFVIGLLILGCKEDEPDLPKYFILNFTDSISLQTSLDTLNIILEQRKNHEKVLDSVPYKIITSSTLPSSLNIKIFFSYGGYSKDPDIKKEILPKQDSVFIWYSLFNRFQFIPNKSNSILKPNLSPAISYTSVDSVEIYHLPSKRIFFRSINY